MLNSAAESKDKLNGRLSTCCWYFACMAVRALLQSHLTFLWKICASVICSIHCLCSFHMFAINLLFRYGENFAWLFVWRGAECEGLPLTLKENLCLDAWCFSLNTNGCFVLFLYTQKMFGWVKIGGDSHQAISGIACSLCTLNQDSLKNKMKLRFFSFCFSGCMIITPDLLNREIQWLVCFLCESRPPFYFWICYCFSNEYNYKISHAVLQKSCVKSSIKSQI